MAITPETRLKLREALKGRKVSKEHAERMSEGRKKYFEKRREERAENKRRLEEEPSGEETPLQNLLRKRHRERGNKETNGNKSQVVEPRMK